MPYSGKLLKSDLSRRQLPTIAAAYPRDTLKQPDVRVVPVALHAVQS